MPFMDLVKARDSTRDYAARPVERAVLERCLEAARLAPSASNVQPWKFVVVDDPPLREAVARATFGPFVSFNRFTLAAPVLIVIVLERSKLSTQVGGIVKGLKYNLIDLGIAAEHFCLQAAEEGLGTCMIGWFQAGAIKRLLHIPRRAKVGLVVAAGYPGGGEVKAKQRKPVDEVRSYNRY